MKKIFMLLAAASALVACDPVEEDFSNGGTVSVEKIREMTTISLNKTEDGQTGNMVSCSTSAPINAKWVIGGKAFKANYAYQKLRKVGDNSITLIALSPNGHKDTLEFVAKVDKITNEVIRTWIYGDPALLEDEDPENDQLPFKPGAWDAAAMRFSDFEGQHLPYLSDEVYFDCKTLVFDISDATEDCAARIMNGWWAATYADGVKVTNGEWELQLTDEIAADCAKGGSGKDLDVMLTSGSCTVNAVYYEE